jgi:hypothetical protein
VRWIALVLVVASVGLAVAGFSYDVRPVVYGEPTAAAALAPGFDPASMIGREEGIDRRRAAWRDVLFMASAAAFIAGCGTVAARKFRRGRAEPR